MFFYAFADYLDASDYYEYVEDSSSHNTFPLVTVDSEMYLCRVSDNINLDVFQTVDEDKEHQISIDSIGIQNFASNIFGTHDCTLKNRLPGLESNAVKLIITKEANTQSNINVNSQFKAEIHTKTQVITKLPSDEKVLLHCPKSGNFLEFFFI